ncbi:MAG: hypothetical protein JWQ18_3316, partial [Conexibacter sp.]|nr:hypothetical protein [Conexibacter sp.]
LATVAAGLALLDRLADRPALERCTALAELVATASRATHWWITTSDGRVVARSASPAPITTDARSDLVATGPAVSLHWAQPAPSWAEQAAASVTLLAREAQRPALLTPPARSSPGRSA